MSGLKELVVSCWYAASPITGAPTGSVTHKQKDCPLLRRAKHVAPMTRKDVNASRRGKFYRIHMWDCAYCCGRKP